MILYVNVDGFDMSSVDKFIYNLNDQLTSLYDDIDTDKYTIKNITIPVRNQDTKYECVYSDTTQSQTENYMVMFYNEIIKNNFDTITMSNINNIMRRIKIKKLLKKTTK